MNKSASTPSRVTPLWIIAAFLSLTEVVVGVAVLKTTGQVQLVLTWFVILFPTAIAVAFFLILWFRNYVLFHPSEYGGKTDVETFVGAMKATKKRDRKLYDNIAEKMHDKIVDDTLVDKIETAVKADPDEPAREKLISILENVVTTTTQDIKALYFITIDTRPIAGDKGREILAPVEEFDNLFDFLNFIWGHLSDFLEPYTFGTRWVLRDKVSREVLFSEILGSCKGCRRTPDKFIELAAALTLEKSGIYPGLSIEVVPINPPFTS